MSMIKVAVLMSTYNGEEYIEEQINSILNQNGDYFLDLYVRDDGSTDKTVDILKKYEKLKKLKYYVGENLKSAKSFMDLLQTCGEYDYYAFADQDDFWFRNKIQKGIDFLSHQKVPALYCSNAELVDERLKSLGRNVYKSTPRTDFKTIVCAGGLLGCTMVFNNALTRIVRQNNPTSMVFHDFYLAILCTAIGGNIIYDNEISMKYRQHDNNVVGVSYGFRKTFIRRIKDILCRERVSIADQSMNILEGYSNYISEENRLWLETVSSYKKSLYNRIRLATTRKTHYINKNMGIKIRLSIILGNR